MPVVVKAAVWNMMTEVGSGAADARDLANFTSLLEWQDRLSLLRSVVEMANHAIPLPTGLPAGTHALRLFLAPEYFFSETCNQHVMDYETRGHVVEGLAKISADFPNLLLIPGTVSYFKPLVDKKLEAKRLKLDPNHKSRVVKYAGCFTVGQEKSTYLAHNTAYAFYNGNKVFKYRKLLDCSELNTQDKTAAKVMVFAKGDHVGVFNFDKAGPTLRIGMEICADHDDGQLNKGGVTNLDLQIVLAASTGMKEGFAMLRDGGCLFMCNANEKSADGKRRAYQRVAGKLVDLRAASPAGTAAERIDPLSRPELRAFRSKTEKLDTRFEKAQLKAKEKVLTGPALTSYVQGMVTTYLQARGGTVHFYEANIP